MLEKTKVIDKIEILEDGTMQIREETRILEDGEIISRSFTNRQVIEPGDDVSQLEQRIKDISGVIHTAEVVTDFQAKKAAKLAEISATQKQESK